MDATGRNGALMRAIRTLQAVGWVTYKEWAVYRSHMLASLFIGPIYFLVQMFIWTAIYSTRDTVGGLQLEEMIAYYGVAALLSYATFDFADWNLQMLIRTGKFTTFLLRPVSHRYFAFSQKAGHRVLGFTLEMIPVWCIFAFVFGIWLVPSNWLWAITSVLLSFILVFLVHYCIGLAAFWMTNTGGLRMVLHLVTNLCAGAIIPLTLFPDWLQQALLVLPFPYMLYVPVRVFIGSYELAGVSLSIPSLVAWQSLIVLFMLLVSELLWRLGIRRFTGVGA
jgi:ABC-2 type transport system permease protein